MKSHRVTLQDIARHTGFSVTAVSRALRGMSDIGPETTALIRQAAHDLGYVANQTAVSLRSGRTNIITVILVNLVNPFFSLAANMLQLEAQAMGYSLIFVCSRDDPRLEVELVEQAIARRSDGVLLFTTNNSGPAIEMLQGARVPFVLLARSLEGYQADTVLLDDEYGGYMAGMHLIENGSRKLAFLSACGTIPSFFPRRDGFLRACQDAGIPESDLSVHVLPYLNADLPVPPHIRQEALSVLHSLRDRGVTGLFVFCDVEACRVMSLIIGSSDLEPRDFDIIGFDGINSAQVSPLPLCSVDCGLEDLSRHAMALLCRRIEGDTSPFQTLVAPAHIVCRGSCRQTRRR